MKSVEQSLIIAARWCISLSLSFPPPPPLFFSPSLSPSFSLVPSASKTHWAVSSKRFQLNVRPSFLGRLPYLSSVRQHFSAVRRHVSLARPILRSSSGVHIRHSHMARPFPPPPSATVGQWGAWDESDRKRIRMRGLWKDSDILNEDRDKSRNRLKQKRRKTRRKKV